VSAGWSVFPTLSMDRERVRWEEYLGALTPVTPGRAVWYKREDAFAPLGYGGINGAKLRQLVHLVHQYVQRGGRAGVLTGASVLSPQNSMAAVVAAHYGLDTTIVLGGTKPESCLRHENVAIAAAAGARFEFVPVGYNPALQRAVADFAARPRYQGHYRLHYGISTPPGATTAEIAAFHALGANQVRNVPAEVRTLVMTLGSAYSAASVLLGVAQHRPAGLRRVVLLGIGPTKLDFLQERLVLLGRAAGVDVTGLFGRRYHHHPGLEVRHQPPAGAPLLLEHYDLHTTGFAAYGDRMPWQQDGIGFHPTYEGKAMAYLARHPGEFAWWHQPAEGEVLFWVIGSAPSLHAMDPVLAPWVRAQEGVPA
jgi:1-aminocyclopropane-1-carboxylate deaminase/D-cysteine desulfhydrase-like pyridoxal-dependent ACC family enzyme